MRYSRVGARAGRMDRVHARVATFGVIAAQIVVGLLLAGLLTAGGDSKSAYDVLAGTLAGTLPGFFFALRLSNLAADATPSDQLRAIYVGETIKIAFASMLLVCAIAFLDVQIGYLITGYAVTVLVNWLVLMSPLPGERA